MQIRLPGHCAHHASPSRRVAWASCRALGWGMVLVLASLWGAVPAWAQQKVRVGVYQNSPKVNLSGDGKPEGIFIDLIEAIAKSEGWQLEYVSGTWSDGLERLERGEIDLMPDVASNPERQELYAFHREPVLASWNQVYARRDSGIRSLLDLQSRRVALLADSGQETQFKQMTASFGLTVTLVPYPDFGAAFAGVALDQADAVVTNRFFGARNANKFALADTAIIFGPSLLYFAAPKVGREALLAAIDKHLIMFKGDSGSVYYRSLQSWGIDEVRTAVPSWLLPLAVGAILVLLAGVAWVVLLRSQVAAKTGEIRRSSEEILVINQTLRATGSRRELGAVLDEALKGALALTGFDGGALCLRDESSGALRVGARLHTKTALGAPEDAGPLSDEVCAAVPPSVLKGQRHTLLAAGASGVPSRNEPEYDDGVRWNAYFPLVVQARILGVLCLFSRQAAPPPVHLMALVEDISGPIALAIENARLHVQSHEHAQELESRVTQRTEELAQINTELRDAKRHAESADRLKSAFLATMSHELRTPLNSIIGFTGIMLQGLAGPLNEEQTKQLGMVRDSARHLLALINDVLDIAKIEAGALAVGCERFDLVKLVEKVVALVRPMADRKGLALAVELSDDVSFMQSDSRRVEQVLLNLLSNAIKFTEAGAVTLSASLVADFQVDADQPPAAAVRLSVADTGIGIKPDDMVVLFTPFRQIDSNLARMHDGTGLGLAICRHLAALMGGRIEARSEWGRGSTFIVTLPMHLPAILEA